MQAMTISNQIDFGYPWWLNFGHLTIFFPSLLAMAAGWRRRWPRWAMAALGLAAVWSGAGFFIVRSLGANRAGELPTQNFLRSGKGRVLDLGAGTGRSSIMVLQSRPETTLVALDLFGDSFSAHFGNKQDPKERLQRNLAAAGMEDRTSIVTSDMRKTPFEDRSFDAAVSAFAIDHLGREGSRAALGEVYRVLKPGGEFLMILVANDAWAKFAFGPLLTHGGLPGPEWWRREASRTGFRVAEEGASPLTLYFVLVRPGS